MCQKSNTKQKVNEPLEKGNYHQVTLIMHFIKKEKKKQKHQRPKTFEAFFLF